MLSSAYALGVDIIVRPFRALDTLLRKGAALGEASGIYLAYLATAVLFYAYKPPGFPPLPPDAPYMHFEGGLGFWLKVHAWNPVFTAIGIAWIGWFSIILKGGKLAQRLLVAVLAAAVPFTVLIVYTNGGMTKPLFGAALVALVAAAVPVFRKGDPKMWRPLVSLFLSVNAISLAVLPLFLVAIALRSGLAYHILEVGMMFWMLGLAAYGVSRITGLSTARAFCAIFLSTISQIFFIFSLHLLGVIPKDALKALMTV